MWIGIALIVVSLAALVSGQLGLIALGMLLFLAGVILVAPACIQPLAAFLQKFVLSIFTGHGTGMIARSNLARNPTRAAITASATMIGMAVIVGMGGMVWSITGGFLGMLQRSLGSDYLVMPPAVAVWGSNVGAREDLAVKLRAITGVEVVSTLRFVKGSLDGNQFSMLGVVPRDYTRAASLTFFEGDPTTAFDAMDNERAIIMNGIMAAQTNHKVGDVVQLSTPAGLKNYTVVGVAGDYLNAKIMTAYISQAYMSPRFPQG